MNPHITLRQLQFLTSLARHLHFGKAAKECCLTQAAFSIGIKKLEDQLDLKLIDRTNKNVFLTAAGLRVVEQAEQILGETQRLEEIVMASKEPFTGKLRLGVIPTIAPFVLPKMLPKIKARWPRLSLSIRENMTASLHKDLIDGELDLILIALPYDLSGVETMSLFKDYFKIALSKQSKLLRETSFDESTLPPSSILLLEDGHCLRNHALHVCNTEHQKKISPYSASSLQTLIQLVDNDLGVTFVTDIAIAGGLLKNTDIATVDMPDRAYREIGFGWRKDSERGIEFGEFANLFAELAPAEAKHI